MSNMSICAGSFLVDLLSIIAVAFLLLSPAPVGASYETPLCDLSLPAIRVDGSSLRTPGVGPVSEDFGLIALDVDSSGWLYVEVSSSRLDQLAWLDAEPEGGGCSAPFSLAERSLNHLLIFVVEPGRLFFQAGLVDPSFWQSAELFFTARHWKRTDLPRSDEPGDDTDTDESTILPFASVRGCECTAEAAGICQEVDESVDETGIDESGLEALSDPGPDSDERVGNDRGCLLAGFNQHKNDEPGDDTDTDESEILPLIGSTGCGWGVEPDNNVAACALSLGLGPYSVVQSRLSPSPNGLGDRDYYVFHLVKPGKVNIFTDGDIEARGVLLDAQGHKLQVSDPRLDGGGIDLEAALPSGRYLVRVEGFWGSDGEYKLHVIR